MRFMYSTTIDDYLEIVKRAKANGKKSGDSMEEEFIEYMTEKNNKPIGATELSMDELLKSMALKGKKALGIETDKDGKTTYKIIKDEENKK